MNKTIWNRGVPPSIGWWPASDGRVNGFYRWWNGSWWSRSCQYDDSIKHVKEQAAERDTRQVQIEWKVRPANWPARSFT